MSLFRSILFSLATAVLMLHSFVPHDHHESDLIYISDEEVPESILDFIALGFHISQADGHLEDYSSERFDFEVADHQLFDVLNSESFLLDINFSSSLILSNRIDKDVFYRSLLIGEFSRRGPPQI